MTKDSPDKLLVDSRLDKYSSLSLHKVQEEDCCSNKTTWVDDMPYTPVGPNKTTESKTTSSATKEKFKNEIKGEKALDGIHDKTEKKVSFSATRGNVSKKKASQSRPWTSSESDRMPDEC